MTEVDVSNSSSPCNSGDNSYYDLSCWDAILKVVEESEIELRPKEIMTKVVSERFRRDMNHSTVKVLLRRLLNTGLIIQPYPGAYCSQRIHGVRFVPLRVHNVVFTVEGFSIGEHWEWREVVGAVGLRVVFGTERDKVSCFVSCDVGMDCNACLFAVRRCLEVTEQRLGRKVEGVTLKTFEANKDYVGYRLDGVTCLTVTGLYETVERVYQKTDGIVRHEVKVTKPTGLDEFMTLIQGGVPTYNIAQSSFALVQEVRKLTEAVKATNSVVFDQGRLVKALCERVWKDQK